MVSNELAIAERDLASSITQILTSINPTGKEGRREIGFNAPANPIEEWARKYSTDFLSTRMLLNNDARIVVATTGPYLQKPWLGVKFWAEPVEHPQVQQAGMTLYYAGQERSAEKWLTISLMDGKQPSIRLGGIINSFMRGRQYLPPQNLVARPEDLRFVRDILTEQR